MTRNNEGRLTQYIFHNSKRGNFLFIYEEQDEIMDNLGGKSDIVMHLILKYNKLW